MYNIQLSNYVESSLNAYAYPEQVDVVPYQHAGTVKHGNEQ